ncbi:Na+/H+ antiporter NhaC [Alkalihalobacillus sp. MEB130]|uniref:Na+/H+ antiporter NhaC n=1 Tax=Alkalihalobacillus sp. MEB130 TaxID=2976704 RepID=UPI0028DDFA94|nr:Na+/H+ antiporter NhaC [Alkalihalobacillus sp. MEB130]MDT8862421.1 Na+/H+ antiporter NhaC [Alkalihalobacillus sp. MEB130]
MLNNNIRLPKLSEIFMVLALFLVIMYCSLSVFNFPIHLPLIAAWFLVIFLGLRLGHSYNSLQTSISNGIHAGLDAILVIIFVGALIGTWIAGGIVPTIIYYGLEIIHPSIFLLATLLICAVTALATGTSWGTVGTAGIAMMGIGESFGIPLPLVAGAVISGAYFGDKLSPLSDTTVLTSSLARVEIIAHIRSMLVIGFPALLISGILFLIAGFLFNRNGSDLSIVQENINALQVHFNVGWYMLIPMLIVIIMLARRVPTIPALAIGSVLGIVWAWLFQGVDVVSAISTLYSGYAIESGVPFIDQLFNRGGIESMLGLIAIMILALGFGGLMDHIGTLDVLRDRMAKFITGSGSLTLATILSAFMGNFFGSAGYVSLITGAKMTDKSYEKLKIDKRVLSRNVETGGTLTAPMVGWSDNGLYMAAVLGVATMSYIPFLWLNFVAIGIALFYGFSGKFIWYVEDSDPNKNEKVDTKVPNINA